MEQSRRDFLKFMGVGLFSTHLLSVTESLYATPWGGIAFPTLDASSADAFLTAKGFEHYILLKEGEAINPAGDKFGFNNDFIGLLERGKNSALMWVNHESPEPSIYSSGNTGGVKTRDQVLAEQKVVGGSLVQLKKSGTRWALQVTKNNKRFDATSPIEFAGGVNIAGHKSAVGTLGNCCGGQTPWGTFLSAEENYADYYGEIDSNYKKERESAYQWDRYFDYSPAHYGWIVEIDPIKKTAKKLTSMGRFAHEGATTTVSKGRVVAYMGDDADNRALYKFVADSATSLETGRLYVAQVETGTWVEISLKHPALKGKFKDHTDLMVQVRQAAELVGASKMDRPEGIAIDPKSKAIVVALTNNKSRGNKHGQLLRLEEKDGDHTGPKFTSKTWITGGEKAGFSCPDNLAFDRKGNLWVTTDISASSLNKGDYKTFKNNGLFYIPMSGKFAGIAHQVASAPAEAELTGPCFSPDGKTLFLSVQHPGERTENTDKPKSSWPDGKGKRPHACVVALTGPMLEKLMS